MGLGGIGGPSIADILAAQAQAQALAAQAAQDVAEHQGAADRYLSIIQDYLSHSNDKAYMSDPVNIANALHAYADLYRLAEKYPGEMPSKVNDFLKWAKTETYTDPSGNHYPVTFDAIMNVVLKPDLTDAQKTFFLNGLCYLGQQGNPPF